MVVISARVKKLINDEDYKGIHNELEYIKKNNYKSYIQTLYGIMKLVPENQRKNYKPTPAMLKEYESLVVIKGKKIVDVKSPFIEQIIKQRYNSPFDLLTYILLNSGRRTSEILENKFELQDNHVYIVIDKTQQTKKLTPIQILLDNNPKSMVKDLDQLRESIKGSLSTFKTEYNHYLHSVYGIHAHLLRAIYARYVFQFRNAEKLNFSFIINKYLNHKAGSGSASFYDQINLIMDKDVFMPNFKKLKHEQLKQHAEGMGISHAKKSKMDLILELSKYY